MALPTGLNDLAKLTLLASDNSYFSPQFPVLIGREMEPLLDTPSYNVLPHYDIVPALEFVVDRQFVDDTSGFKALAFRNVQTNEVILAFGGTDGLNSQDWASNVEHLGWNQWTGDNRGDVFNYLTSLAPTTKLHFTGQSLGGALAQYAAYEYVQAQQTIAAANNTTFDASRISLTTFNALGGRLGLQRNSPAFNPALLDDLGVSAHFVIDGDLVSRLGGGHVGGPVYQLDFVSTRINPDTGQPYFLDLLEGHRIETGFYANLAPLPTFEEARLLSPTEVNAHYLPTASLQKISSLLGNILNDKDVSPAESLPRVFAGISAGLAFGDQSELNNLVKAVLKNLADAGTLTAARYAALNAIRFGAVRPLAGAVYPITLIAAGLADAAELGTSGIQSAYSAAKEFLGLPDTAGPSAPGSVPPDTFFGKMKAFFSFIPIILSANESISSGQIARLNLDHNEYAQVLLDNAGATWRTDTLAWLRSKAMDVHLKPAEIDRVTVAFYASQSTIPGLDPTELTVLAQERDAFIKETSSGFANALPDFIQKITNVAFSLGQTITSFSDIQLIDQAYAAELSDPRLSSSIRPAIEEARQIVQHAGQTVVIQNGVGPNPFDTPGFAPGGASTATVGEQLGQVFRLSLPFAAGTGGQRVSLQLQGPQTSQLSVSTSNGVQAIGASSVFALTVPEGEDQLYFALLANDSVPADATVMLSATLVDANDQPTHTTQVESVVTVKAFVGTTDPRYGTYAEDWSSITDPNLGIPMGAGGFIHQTLIGGAGPDSVVPLNLYGDDRIQGNGGNDNLFGGRGHDELDGGLGHDRLIGDYLDDGQDEPWTGFFPGDPGPDPRSTRDGRDYLDGGAGDDGLAGGGSDDRLIGGSGNDTLWGDAYTFGKTVQNPDGSLTTTYLTGVLHPANDVLEGGEGNDYLSGDGGDDTLDGGTGDDMLVGDTDLGVNATLLYPTTPGNDFLAGGDGNDQLYGNAGSDVLLGGSGNDLLFGDDEGVEPSQEGDDWLEGGDGIDQLMGRGGHDTLIGGADADVLSGGAGNDVLVGGDGDDGGYGGAGDDEIVAGAGADQFDGEAGDDILFGDDGNDLLLGGEGLDEIDGGAGDDLLAGGDDDDVVFGDDGNDELQGGRGADLLAGDEGDDRLFGEDGADELFGDRGADVLVGGADDDVLMGGEGNDQLIGDEGNDQLVGDAGNDVLVGGRGQDTFQFEPGGGFDVLVDSAGEGNRVVFGAGISASAVVAGVGPNDSLVVRTGNGTDAVQILDFGTANPESPHPIDQFEFFDGTVLTYAQLAARGLVSSGGLESDTLAGTVQHDDIYGGAGDDTIDGIDGGDAIRGEDGADRLQGGAGTDVLLGGSGNDVLLGGSEDDALFGGVGIDQLFGESGNDTIRGGADGDYAEGGADDDSIFGETGDDWIFGDSNPNTVPPGGSVPIGGNDVIDGGDGNDDLRGGEGQDTLLGGSGNDLLDGGEGDDLLDGEAGDDARLDGGPGVDIVYGGAGNDRLYSGWRVTDSGGEGGGEGGGEPGALVAASQGVEQLFGEEGDDYLNSGSENFNTNDTVLDGGAGNDTFVVDSAGDAVIEAAAGGVDTIETFVSYTLPDNVENLTFAGLAGVVGTGNALANVMRGMGQGTLDGRGGDDTLIDAQAYRFGRGDGQDTIVEYDTSGAPYFPGGPQDTIHLGAGIAPTDVVWQRMGNDLVLAFKGTTDSVTIPSFYDVAFNQGDYRFSPSVYSPGAGIIYVSSLPYYVAPAQIERVQFADGAVWGPGAFNATQVGSFYADHYVFGRGDGQDTIIDFDFTSEQPADILQVTEGISSDDVTVSRLGNDFVLGIEGTAEQFTVQSHFTSVFVLPPFAVTGRTVKAYQLEQVQFADGAVWDAAAILDRLEDVIGTEGDDDLQGGRNNSVIRGLGGTDTLEGRSGDDRLDGGAGDDTLNGDEGDDQLIGGPGNDLLRGGAGHDTYLFNLGDGIDTIEDVSASGEGNRIQFGDGITQADLTVTENQTARTLTIQIGGGTDQVVLTNFDPTRANGSLGVETLVFADGSTQSLAGYFVPAVTEGDDVIMTGAGDDVVDALGGNDRIEAGAGNDSITGGAGADLLIGGSGDDTLHLSLDGAWTSGFVAKNSGSPGAAGTGQTVSLKGKNRSFDVFHGDAGLDRILGTAGDDALGLDDLLSPFYDAAGPRLAGVEIIDVGDGRDVVDLTSQVYVYGDVTLTGGNGDDVLWASAGNDVLEGGAGNDSLYGGAGIDEVIGGDGNDTLDGASGGDSLRGGPGNDVYLVDDGADVVIEHASEGTDTVKSAITYALGADLEHLTLTGVRAINGTGNGLNNQLTGNSAANVLAGGAGNDTLRGGAGSDAYLFSRGDGQDVIAENDATAGNLDRLLFGESIDPLDLVLSRQVNDLRIVIHGTNERVTIQNWYGSPSTAQVEDLQAGNGQHLVNMQVDQLIQAMAGFSQQTGLSWDQAIEQRPQEIQAVLAASWQS